MTYSHFLYFVYVGTSCPRQRSVGLEGADGPVGFEPVAEKCDVVLTPRSSASGLVTAVDNTVLVSSSHPLLAPCPLSVFPITFPPFPNDSQVGLNPPRVDVPCLPKKIKVSTR